MDELYNTYKSDSDSEKEVVLDFEFSNLEKKLKFNASETLSFPTNAITNQPRKRKLENLYGPIYDNVDNSGNSSNNNNESIFQKNIKKQEPVVTFSKNRLQKPQKPDKELLMKQFSIIPKRKINTFSTKNDDYHLTSILWCGSFVLASASMNGSIKIWDVFRSKKCVQTIQHNGAVKDVQWDFNHNNILSGGFDNIVKLSDIEAGKTIQSFLHQEIITSLRFHPTQTNIFVSGMMKDGIKSWDIRSNKIIKETKKFWGGVNDLEFFPDGNKLLTCSDYVVKNAADKNIIVWDFDSMTSISNQIYQEAFSCTALRIHPLQNHFVAQSNGNYIAIFGIEKPWKLEKRKRFESHHVNGYPIRCNFSLESNKGGQFLASGDADGRIIFYDWFTTHPIKIIENAHREVCTDICWHPVLTNTFASCGWDGTISLWE
ncbi:19065_t:CDS:2 [Entrophospora sp. SA101]|nr:11767_t:CDS:2 [Entrophospora sp. SA101]CAJ0755077.1 19065_t:CDS:2 [Entrophospora sp. SA101]CAJ0905227.1 8508_t:CDS:2 [Entrophospora sp. SA101]